ncbi:CBS domain-containing protein [Pseudomonas sp. KNUC1026]|uniref:CBS domain-containing protein n=1 Tax=Pseudomonas sp. KNUC1026 TaxID=2893890 RepID=UPI003FA74986
MVAGALLYNNLTRRRWPHRDRAPSAEARLQQSDLDTALARYNQVLDISRDDLQALLEQAESAAYQRTMGVIRCADVMTPDPVVARADMPLQAAWALMRKHRVKALPVIDSQLHLVGIVTVADFMRQVDMDVHEGMAWRLRSLLRPKAPSGDSQVGQIMTRNVRVSSGDRLLIDLVPVFSVAGHRHIPIIDQDRRLAGIITQSDLIKALYKAVHG